MTFEAELHRGLATLPPTGTTPLAKRGGGRRGATRKGGPRNGGVSVGRVQDRGGVTPGAWLTTDRVIESVPLSMLVPALVRAGDDYSRLWYDADGSLWIMNHRANTSCSSPACAACRFRESVAHKKAV